MGTVRVLWTLVAKDFRLESRNRDVVLSIILFAGLVIAIFAIATGTRRALTEFVAPGVLWVGFAFSAVIGISRSAAHETEGGFTPLVLLAPVSRELIWLGKTIGHALFLAISLVAIVVVHAMFFDALVVSWWFIAVSVLVVIGFSGVGTLFATITQRVRAREVLLPMMFLPLTMPLLLAAVEVTSGTLAGRGWSDFGVWVMLSIAYDVIFITAAALLYPIALEE